MFYCLVKTITYAALLWCGMVNSVFACPGGTMNTGWCWPTKAGAWTEDYLAWHGYNDGFNGKHLAKDIAASEGDDVYAVDYGVVLITRTDVGYYGGATCDGKGISGAGVVVRHYTSSGKAVDVLYAHLKDLQVKRGDVITPGTVIAKIRNYTWCSSRMDHLHFGVVFSARDLSAYNATGIGDVWAGYGASDRGFVNPVDFFATNTKGNKIYSCDPSKERCLFRINGPVAWYPPVDDCQQASQWFNMATVNGEKTMVGSTTKSSCPLACYAN